MSISAAMPAQLPATSAPALLVPADFAAKLHAAVKEGVADADTFAREHTPKDRWMAPDWALLKMGWPPDEDAPELAYLHDVARGRTPDGIAAARRWSSHGLEEAWEGMLAEYTAKVGPARAKAGARLLHDALMMVNTITQTGKSAAQRDRPFVVDPTLPLAVERPGNNPSYPSGHTSAAIAAGMVLSYLMPDRGDEFMSLAHEASWARIYAGVHFPSDVVAGAKLAATVVSVLTRSSGAARSLGTSQSSASLSGDRRRLPGAVTLHGTHLPQRPVPIGSAA